MSSFCLQLIFICYGLIVARLLVSRPTKDIATESSSYEMSSYSSAEVTPKKKKTSSSDGDRRRVTLMCGVFVLAFVCCWLPFHVVHMAKINGIYNTSVSNHMGFISKYLKIFVIVFFKQKQ